jgi:hypothetical protein
MEHIWEEPKELLNYQDVKTVDWTDSCCREDAVRLHIPELACCGLNCLGSNEESVGSLICCHSGKNDFKEVDLSYPFLRSLLSRKSQISCEQGFEHFVGEHCSEDRLKQLGVMIYCWQNDLEDILRNDAVILEAKENILVQSILLQRLDKCLELLSDHENLIVQEENAPKFGNSSKLTLVARYMSNSEETFDDSESVSHLTDRVLSKKNLYCEELDRSKRRLHKLTAVLKRTLDYLLALEKSPAMQAAVIKKRKFSKEEALKFALSQECYLDHVRNFVGDSDRVYLLVFASNPGSSANVWTMDVLSDRLDVCLDPYCRTKVKVFYFHGNFGSPLDYFKLDRSDLAITVDSAPH